MPKLWIELAGAAFRDPRVLTPFVEPQLSLVDLCIGPEPTHTVHQRVRIGVDREHDVALDHLAGFLVRVARSQGSGRQLLPAEEVRHLGDRH